MAAQNDGLSATSVNQTMHPWHDSVDGLLQDVSVVVYDFLHERLAERSPAECAKAVHDLAMMYLRYMEKIELIALHPLTGELVHTLRRAEWDCMADNFVSWFDELVLESSAKDLNDQIEVDAAIGRALEYFEGTSASAQPEQSSSRVVPEQLAPSTTTEHVPDPNLAAPP